MTAIASLPGFAVMPAGNMVSGEGNQAGATADFAALLAARIGDLQGIGNATGPAQSVLSAGATRFVDGPLFGHWIGAAPGGTAPNAKAGAALAPPLEGVDVKLRGAMAQSLEHLHEVLATAGSAVGMTAVGERPVGLSLLPSSTSAVTGPAQVLGLVGEDDVQVSAPKAQLPSAALALRAARVAGFAPLQVALLAEAGGHRLVLRAARMPDDESQETVAHLVEEAERAGVSISAVTVNGKPFSLYGSF